MTANILNWVFVLMAGRLLTKEAFAVLTVFTTLQGLLSVPANALATTVSRYTAYFEGKKAGLALQKFLQFADRFAWLAGLITMVLLWLSTHYLSLFFKIDSLILFGVFAPVTLFLFLSAYNRGILKGRLSFTWVGILMIVETSIRCLSLLVALLLKFDLLVAGVFSLTASWLVVWLVGALALSQKPAPQLPAQKRITFNPAETLAFTANASTASIGIMLMNTISVLLVKHYFSETDAGIYSILSLFGKILFFGAGGLIELLVPFVTRDLAKNKSGKAPFFLLVGIVLTLATPVALMFSIFPSFIATLFLGQKGLVAVPYIPLYSIAMVALLMVNCINAFNTAKKNFVISRLIVMMALVQSVLIVFFHNSIAQVIWIVNGSIISLLGLLLIQEIIKEIRKPKASHHALSLATLINSTFKKTKKQNVVLPLPNKIGDWKLKQVLTDTVLQRPHQLAIYTSGRKKVMAKIWSGTEKDFHYQALKNEANLYQLLTNVQNRIRPTLPKKLKHVALPTCVAVKETSTRLILMTEYVIGKTARDLPSTQRNKLYFDAVAYLRLLSEALTNREKKQIATRTFKDYLVLFPALWSVALLRQPKLFLHFCRAGYYFIASLPYMFNESELKLVHRDLHTHNILVSTTKKAYLIDFQRTVLTYQLYEYVTTLPIEWNDEKLRKAIIKQAQKEAAPAYFRGLLANFSVHGLTANNLPSLNIERFKKALLFVTN